MMAIPQIVHAPLPYVHVQLLTDKYAKPKDTIDYMDIGASASIMDPKILPPELWTDISQKFHAANGETFEVTKITRKRIGLKFFPDCIIWSRFFGSSLPDKDILIGMDCYLIADPLRILPLGIKYEVQFQPYSQIPKLFSINHQTFQEKLQRFSP